MLISLIVAMAENRVIGRDGGMPWHLPGDLRYFKAVTLGKPVVMGRKTFESIGKPLPGRPNVVITRDANYAPDGAWAVGSLDEGLKLAQRLAGEDGADEIMVIGGGQIYAEALDVADRVYLTEVHMSVDGDTVFPELPPAQWREISREGDEQGEDDSAPALSFVVMERARS